MKFLPVFRRELYEKFEVKIPFYSFFTVSGDRPSFYNSGEVLAIRRSEALSRSQSMLLTAKLNRKHESAVPGCISHTYVPGRGRKD